MTQAQLAELLGKHQSFVSKSERGERRVDFTEFLELIDAMKLDEHQFVSLYRERIKNLKISTTKRVKRT